MGQQTILRTLTILAALSVAAPATAQTATAPSRHTQTPTQLAAPASQPAAPIGHRQPRVTDAPADQSGTAYPPDRPSPEDEAMNRRINGICRGC